MLPLVTTLRCWMLLPSFLLTLVAFFAVAAAHCSVAGSIAVGVVDLDVGHDAVMLLTM